MKCPIDTTVDLVMSDRQGIEIDYCPTCRGVWLDRGELDKLIERSHASATAAPLPAAAAPRRDDDRRYDDDRRRYDDDDRRRYDDGHDRYRKKKKAGLLGEIFDF